MVVGTQGVHRVMGRGTLERRVEGTPPRRLPHLAHSDQPVCRVEPAWGLAVTAGHGDRLACQSQACMLS